MLLIRIALNLHCHYFAESAELYKIEYSQHELKKGFTPKVIKHKIYQ